MKKWTVFILCLLLLLGGCGKQAPKHLSEAEDFTWYVNISDENIWDLAPFMDTQLRYMLLTKEPLDKDDLVTLSVTNACQTYFVECSEEWMTEFPLWLYQTYRGVDWKEATALAEAAQRGDAKAKKKLAEYETLYLEEYKALSADDLPQVYGYWVTNNVTTADHTMGLTAAQYTYLPLGIGSQEAMVDVGLLNVFCRGWDQYLASEEVDEDIYAGRLADACPSYWEDGTVTLAPILLDEVYPQTLTGMELYGIQGEILDIRVSFGGNTQSWDGISTLELPAQTEVQLLVTLQTQANQTVGYCEDANLMLQREINGQTQRLWYFASISQSWNVYELYAMMVDGLDIASYYAYSTQWKQPEPISEPQVFYLPFAAVILADTEEYSLSVTGVSWDDHACTLHFSAGNLSKQKLELSLGDVYINGMHFGRDYTIPLSPGEAGEYEWRIAWEAMSCFGIEARTGDDISSIEFTLNPLYNGMLPVDEAGIPVINTESISLSPMGTTASQNIPATGTVELETDVVSLYVVHFDEQPYSCLTSTYRPFGPALSLRIENRSEQPLSYLATNFCINGVAVDAVDAGTFRGERSCFRTIQMYLPEDAISKIGEPEVLSFALRLNDADTYTVTIDLTEEMEG